MGISIKSGITNMKKHWFIILLLSVFVCTIMSSCKNDDIVYVSGNFWGDDSIVSDEGTLYEKDVIPDKETALNVAKSIFDSMDIGEDHTKYDMFGVMYDEDDGVWIVIFSEERKLDVTDDASNIAIRQTDGAV